MARWEGFMQQVAERLVAERIKLPVTLADFGGNVENFQRFLLSQPHQIPCGWDERDYKGV